MTDHDSSSSSSSAVSIPKILTHEVVPTLLQQLDASDVLECYYLSRNALLDAPLFHNATVRKMAIGLRYDPPAKSHKAPLELTLEYGPQRVGDLLDRESTPSLQSDDNHHWSWENKGYVYYTTSSIAQQFQWKSAYYMASLTGAVLETLLQKSVAYNFRRPHYQPFTVLLVNTNTNDDSHSTSSSSTTSTTQNNKVMLKSSSSSDFVYDMWSELVTMGVDLRPILMPPTYRVELFTNGPVEKVSGYNDGRLITDEAASFYQKFQACWTALATLDYSAFVTTTEAPSSSVMPTTSAGESSSSLSSVPTTTLTVTTPSPSSAAAANTQSPTTTNNNNNSTSDDSKNDDKKVKDDDNDEKSNNAATTNDDDEEGSNNNENSEETKNKDDDDDLNNNDLKEEEEEDDDEGDDVLPTIDDDHQDDDDETKKQQQHSNLKQKSSSSSSYDWGSIPKSEYTKTKPPKRQQQQDKDGTRFLLQQEEEELDEAPKVVGEQDEELEEEEAVDNDDVFLSELSNYNLTTTNNPSSSESNNNNTNETSTSLLPSVSPSIWSIPNNTRTRPPQIDIMYDNNDNNDILQKAAQQAKEAAQIAQNSPEQAASAATQAADAAQKTADLSKWTKDRDNLLSGDGTLVATALSQCWTDARFGLATTTTNDDNAATNNANTTTNSITAYLYFDGNVFYRFQMVEPYLQVNEHPMPMPTLPSDSPFVYDDFVDWTLAFFIMGFALFGLFLLIHQASGLRLISPFFSEKQKYFFNPTGSSHDDEHHDDDADSNMDDDLSTTTTTTPNNTKRQQQQNNNKKKKKGQKGQGHEHLFNQDVIPVSMGGHRMGTTRTSELVITNSPHRITSTTRRNSHSSPGSSPGGRPLNQRLMTRILTTTTTSPSSGGGGDLELVNISHRSSTLLVGDDDDDVESSSRSCRRPATTTPTNTTNDGTTTATSSSRIQAGGGSAEKIRISPLVAQHQVPPKRFTRHPDWVDMPNLSSRSKVAEPFSHQFQSN